MAQRMAQPHYDAEILGHQPHKVENHQAVSSGYKTFNIVCHGGVADNPLFVAQAFHMGTGLCLSCSSPDPASYLGPGKTVEDDPRSWALVPMGEL